MELRLQKTKFDPDWQNNWDEARQEKEALKFSEFMERAVGPAFQLEERLVMRQFSQWAAAFEAFRCYEDEREWATSWDCNEAASSVQP